jgi:molecular chaperone DnaJ
MPHSSLTVDPYAVLGVPRDASPQAIKQAYRRIALDSHPDRHSKNPASIERFRRASESYALLRDPERRLVFDKTGRWDDTRWEQRELDIQLAEALEIFARDFGAAVDIPVTDDRAPAHTGRIAVNVDISYEEVERGGRRRIVAPCAHCAGSGAREGSTQVRCTSCGGSGRLRHVESSFLGPRIHTESCGTCHGAGRRPLLACPACNGSGRSPGGESIDVVIPRGTAEGDSLASLSGGSAQFVARLVEDPRWARDGADLYATGRIPYEVAVLGGAVDVELPGRNHRMDVAAGTASGHRLRIPDRGLPLRDGSGRGNLILTLHVAVPERVGRVERWLLRQRLGRSDAMKRPGLAARLSRLQARARETAGGQWSQWRAHHHRSSLLRIEKAAASLRSAAGLLSESEQRLGPFLERGFTMVAPEAARARGRLDGGRLRHAALAEFVVDSVLVTCLGAGLWLLVWYAEPAIAAAGQAPWWALLRQVHPASVAVLPILAGLGTGALRVVTPRRWVQRLVALPLGVAVAAAAAATGAAMYATAMRVAPAADYILVAAMSVIAAFAVGIAPAFLFILGDTIVDSARKAVAESSDRVDRRTLRKYDVATARLATHLEGTERAFRELLTQADDARHPLTSLLNGAAETLAGDRHRRPRSTAVRAALALAGSIGVTAVWIAATALAVVTAFSLFPEAATWSRLATAATAAALCAIGSLLPAVLLERHRNRGVTTALATAVAVLALAGTLTSASDPAGFLAAAAAIAALALSFRLPESVRATNIAAVIVASWTLALVLWPVTLAHAVLRKGAARGA